MPVLWHCLEREMEHPGTQKVLEGPRKSTARNAPAHEQNPCSLFPVLPGADYEGASDFSKFV